MATRNGKYKVVELGEDWSRTSVENSKVAIPMETKAISEKTVAHIPECDDNVASLAAPATPSPLTKPAVMSPTKPPEPYDWSATQQQVEAYVSSLEPRFSKKNCACGWRNWNRIEYPH